MQKLFDKLTATFRKMGGEISYDLFDKTVKQNSTLFEDSETIFLLLQASGYPIESSIVGYRLKTYFTPWKSQEYVIIDIETNGSKPLRSQIIEIGAVKLRDEKVVDSFESFINCTYLPEHIANLTGIKPSYLIDAPSQKEVLTKLRAFLGDSVFVAHNVSFDFNFLNASFYRFGLGYIGNQRLCTIDLAKRTFESERYGLAYLNEKLNLNMESHHRAYSDALTASKILLKSFESIPKSIKTADELIRFSKSSKLAKASVK